MPWALCARMRAVIICAGEISDYDYIKSQVMENDTVICADGGYNHTVRMGLSVSAVVGDFDSIGPAPMDVTVPVYRYPEKKDLTDSEIAVEYARAKGFKDFLFLAATGSRLDHTLTNILLLEGCLKRGENAVIVNEHNKIMITGSELHLHEPAGTIVSLVPIAPCRGVGCENLEYPLHDADLFVGKGLGVSNVMRCENAKVTVREGVLLVIAARD